MSCNKEVVGPITRLEAGCALFVCFFSSESVNCSSWRRRVQIEHVKVWQLVDKIGLSSSKAFGSWCFYFLLVTVSADWPTYWTSLDYLDFCVGMFYTKVGELESALQRWLILTFIDMCCTSLTEKFSFSCNNWRIVLFVHHRNEAFCMFELLVCGIISGTFVWKCLHSPYIVPSAYHRGTTLYFCILDKTFFCDCEQSCLLPKLEM